MGLIRGGRWAVTPLGFIGGSSAVKNPVSNARNFVKGSYIAVPAGYYNAAMILPIKNGAIGMAVNGVGGMAGTMKSIGRIQATLAGECIVLGKLTLLVNQPCTMNGIGIMSGRIKSVGRLGCKITIGSQPSSGDNASAVMNSLVEGGLTLRDVMKLLLAVSAGNATGLDGNPAFKAQDGSKERLAGIISGGTRTITTIDVS